MADSLRTSRSPADRLLDTLFPPRCLGCGLRGKAICEVCYPQVPRLPIGACGRCALPEPGSRGCSGCRKLKAPLAVVRAACIYAGTARAAVHTLKFRQGRYMAATMGRLIGETLAVRPLAADVVVPAPIAPGRLRERGYNQAKLLAEHVAPLVGGTLVPGVLAREDRAPQQTLDGPARLRNLDGAVRCMDPTAIQGKRVLLVDDVLTTGATASAAAVALAQAGAAWVGALVFARDP